VVAIEPYSNGKFMLNLNARLKMSMKLRFNRPYLLWALLTLFLLPAVPANGQGLGVQKGRKRIDTWLVLNHEKGFQRIRQYADILNSLSVVGNPSEEFIHRSHQLHIEVYHLVTGKASDVDTPAHRRATVDRFVHECQAKGYDGIDLDFEHLDPSLRSAFSDFLRQISSALHKIGKKLSICVGCYPNAEWNSPEKQFYDPKVVGETCDLIRVMCYDMYWAPGWKWANPQLKGHPDAGIGPTSTYLWARAGMRFWLGQVPREKLVMGLPAYSNDYALGPQGSGKQVYASKPQVQAPTKNFWLWHERLPMYLYMEDAVPHIFYASDAESTRAQLKTVDDLDLPSIGFWEFSSMDKATWAAIRAWLKNK
jgi:Glycosyl hydrolases family 18